MRVHDGESSVRQWMVTRVPAMVWVCEEIGGGGEECVVERGLLVAAAIVQVRVVLWRCFE